LAYGELPIPATFDPDMEAYRFFSTFTGVFGMRVYTGGEKVYTSMYTLFTPARANASWPLDL
jgi:hypothetical protein